MLLLLLCPLKSTDWSWHSHSTRFNKLEFKMIFSFYSLCCKILAKFHVSVCCFHSSSEFLFFFTFFLLNFMFSSFNILLIFFFYFIHFYFANIVVVLFVFTIWSSTSSSLYIWIFPWSFTGWSHFLFVLFVVVLIVVNRRCRLLLIIFNIFIVAVVVISGFDSLFFADAVQRHSTFLQTQTQLHRDVLKSRRNISPKRRRLFSTFEWTLLYMDMYNNPYTNVCMYVL